MIAHPESEVRKDLAKEGKMETNRADQEKY